MMTQPIGMQPELMHHHNGSAMALTSPRLEIVEQPKSRGFRFRYDCEGQSHGGLPGENSEKNRRQKTYPTVKLVGYRGRARVMVSLVTDTDPAHPHAHSIVGKNTHDGRCIVEMGTETEMYAQFPNMGILHVTKKKVPDVLTRRILQGLRILDNAMLDNLEDDVEKNFQQTEIDQVRVQAKEQAKHMNLSVVRLCFQAFLMDEHGRFTIPVDPVFSLKVYDSKAPSAGNLKICRLDRANGSVKGGDDVFLLCDKVQKNDIEIIFYEDRPESSLQSSVQPWSAKGRFGPNDVHHQYAIVFQTPPFYNLAVEKPVQVMIALRRPSDSELSESKPFLYLPQEFDEERIGAKRKKKVQHFGNFFGDGGGAGFGGGAGAGGGGGGGMGNFFSKIGDMSFSNYFREGGGNGSSGGGYVGGGNTAAGAGNNFNNGLSGLFDDQSFSSPGQAMGGASRSFGMPAQQDGLGQHFTPSNAHDFSAESSAHNNMLSYRPEQQGYESQPTVDQYQQQHHPPTYPMGHPNYGNVLQGRGATETPMVTDSAAVKQEKMDPEYGDHSLETDGRPSGSSDPLSRHPHHLDGAQGKGTVIDAEDFESGLGLESGISTMPAADETEGEELSSMAEVEVQSAHQAVADRQQAAFAVCERMFNALLAWATTRDVRYLLAAQRSLTAVQNQQGDTALHLAIIHNHQDVVLQLLDVLPQLPPTETPVVDCLNNLKQSPLHLAMLTQQHKVIQFLLKANANPLVCDREGNTPLHLACRMGFLRGAVALLNRTNHINAEGCRFPEVNIRNSNGETPLHLAASNGHTEVLKLLVGARADVDVQDSKSGRTALHHSVEKNDLPMAGYLITEANCNLDCCDFSGNTPLHLASGLGRSAIASLLLAGGADIHALNQEGEAPLDHAKCRSHDDIIHLLEEATEKGSGTDPEDLLSLRMETVSIKQEGDSLSQLDYRARLSLAILLDQSDDWRRLCHLMNLSALEGGFATFTSPTKDLLTMYEAYDGTVSQLRQFLVELNRSDAVNIIDRALESKKEEENSASKGEGSSSSHGRGDPGPSHRAMTQPHMLIDSGINSQTASEDLTGHFGSTFPSVPTSSPSHSTLDPLATAHS